MYEEADSTKLRKKKKKKKAKCFLDITGKQNFHTITTSFFSFVCVDGLFFLGSGGLAKCETNGFSKLRELYNNVYLQKE